MNDKKDFLFRFISLEKRKMIKMDNEAFYSVTDQYTADRISKDIIKVLPHLQIITDATACIGGNTYSFSKYFTQVHAIELDFQRYHYLQNNLTVLETNNVDVYHGDLMVVCQQLYQDLIFIDPPWGGPEYKTQDLVDLYLSSIPLANVCERCCSTTKYIALKTPTNFNIDKFLEDTKSYMTLIHKNTKLRKLNLYLFETFSS